MNYYPICGSGVRAAVAGGPPPCHVVDLDAVNDDVVALGRGGALEPMLAGWMANLLFLSFALYLLLKVRY